LDGELGSRSNGKKLLKENTMVETEVAIISEDRIYRLLQNRDKKSIDLIYAKYADSLYGIALRMVKDEMSAMDVLQESFIKVWKKGLSYDPEKSRLFTWLLNILRNTAIDKLRQVQKNQDREIRIDDSNVYTIEGDEIRPELLDVKDQVKTLDPKYQAVIEAMFFLGMSQQEVSEYLDIPLGTVKTRLRIGLRELKKVFGVESIASVIAILLAS